MNCYYIYVHKRKGNGEPFYYGKGKGNRAWDISEPARAYNKYYWRVLQKHGVVVEIIKSNLSESEAFEEEIRAISEALYRNEKITNISKGGDGFNSESGKQAGIKGGVSNSVNRTGFCKLSKEERREIAIKAGNTSSKVGGPSKAGKASWKKNLERGTGINRRSPDKMREDGKKSGAVGCKVTNSQKWKCCECDLTSTASGVWLHQRTSNIS